MTTLDIRKDPFQYLTGILTLAGGSMNPMTLVPIVSGLFRGGRVRTTRIAVEQEYLVADATTGGSVPIERIGRAARMAAAAPYLGFEPGGQVELSLPCMRDPAAASRTL